MAKKITKLAKGKTASRGNPILSMRVPREFIMAIDKWAGAKGHSRSAAIRLLIERGLKR
jgi:hypothetical protein